MKNIDRDTEIKLQINSGKTLQEVGNAFGLTRERIRQIAGHGKSHIIKKEKRTSFIKRNPHLSSKNIAKILHLNLNQVRKYRKSFREPLDSCNSLIFRASEIEENIHDVLLSKGFNNTLMPHMHPYDIELQDGRKIDVKASFHTIHPKSQYSPFYSFKLGKKRRGEYADFFILVVVPTNDIYIIPNSVLKPGLEYIRIPELKTRQKSHSRKYDKFKNNFDVLL